MCSVSVPQRVTFLVFGSTLQSTRARDRGLCMQEPVPEALWAHSTAHSKGTHLGICCLQQLLAFCGTAPCLHSLLSFSNLCCWGLQAEAENMSQAGSHSPRAGPQQHLQPAAVPCELSWPALCKAEQGADGKGEPSHGLQFSPGTAVQRLAAPASSDPAERTVQRNSSSFLGSEHSMAYSCGPSPTWLTPRGTTDDLKTVWVWAHEKGKLQNRGLKQSIKFNYIFIELCIFHCIMIYIGYSIM